MKEKISHFVNSPNLGLFIIRLFAGIIFVAAGIPKFAGGADSLKGVGSAVETFGIDFAPLLWGVLAATAELVGGLLIILGVCTRISAFFLFCTMVVASAVKIDGGGDILKDAGYPIMLAAVSLGLLFTGSGNFAVKKDSM
ncbi:DoxX family protein [Cerasicoccus maritimus]|uniref:DoxX family protein n=1 Tax=Cerasicoccus maritimus TaxID=490089 RepID=UPI0028526A3F|nr:DoxX family protein [Cerasicoccus maritimus]